MFPTKRFQKRRLQSASLASKFPLSERLAGEKNGWIRNRRGQCIRRGVRHRVPNLERGLGLEPWEFVGAGTLKARCLCQACKAKRDRVGVYQDRPWTNCV